MCHIFIRLTLLLALTNTLFSIPGWYPSKRISSKVIDFSVFVNNHENNAVIISERLKNKFKKHKPTTIVLNFHKIIGTKITTKKITEVSLPPAPTLFPLHARIAVFKKKAIAIWQVTNYKKGGSRIDYIYTENLFHDKPTIKTLPDTGINASVLPQIKVSNAGLFYVFYQESSDATRFTLKQAIGQGGVFTKAKKIISNIKFIGRGVFFPSIAFKGNRIVILYQNRLESSLKDEIFRVDSINAGTTYLKPKRITTNNYNDFSPKVNFGGKTLQWVWQSNPQKSWIINYQSTKKAPIKISKTRTNCYLPEITYAPKTGNIVAWHDTRERTSQIYARFLQGKSSATINEHNVSNSKANSTHPILITLNKKIYLFYLTRGTLRFNLADTSAKKLKLSSKNINSNSISTEITRIKWSMPNEPSKVDMYAYVVNNKKNTNPSIYNLNGNRKHMDFKNLSGGKYYFHIKYRDKAGNESPVSSYSFTVDHVPPETPLISSSTHRERIESSLPDIKFTVTSNDNIGIEHFEYAFSPNRAAKLKKISTKNTFLFKEQSPDNYYFMIRAVDASGNKSDIAIFPLVIVDANSKNLVFSSNIKNGQISANKIQFKIVSQRKELVPDKLFYSIAEHKIRHPEKKGKKSTFKYREDNYKSTITLKHRSKGIYIASLRIYFKNSTLSIMRYFHFEKTSSKKRPSKSSQIIVAKIKKKKIVIIPKILSENTNNIFKINFEIAPKFKKRLLGYAWQITAKPNRPDSELNSFGGPEYVYNLSPGTYWLSVRPIIKKTKFDRKKSYAYTKIIVRSTQKQKNSYLPYLLAIILILISAILLISSKFRFFLSRLRFK